VAEHHATMLTAEHTSQANQSAQAAAVKVIDMLQIQYHILRIECQFLHFDLQRLHLIARHDAPVASYDRDVSNSLVL